LKKIAKMKTARNGQIQNNQSAQNLKPVTERRTLKLGLLGKDRFVVDYPGVHPLSVIAPCRFQFITFTRGFKHSNAFDDCCFFQSRKRSKSNLIVDYCGGTLVKQ